MTKIRAIRWLGAATMTLLSLASVASAAPAQGDYNGDGLSDLAVANVDKRAKTTAWVVRNTANGQTVQYNFKVPADALVTGRFFGDGRTYPGVVYVSDARTPLNWYIKNPAGAEVYLNYGLPGDTVPNQGDMDCDGVSDLVVARNISGYKVWFIALSSQGGTIAQDLFGLATDRIAVADMDGDGCQEMIALRDGYQWFTKKLMRPEVSQVQWGLPGDIPLLPLDIDIDGKADYIIARPTGAGQAIYVRRSGAGGQAEIFPAGQDSSIPVTGNFVGAPSFAWFQRDTGFAAILGFDRTPIVFGFGNKDGVVIRPDGTVVQPTDSGRFGSNNPPPPTGGGGGGVGSLSCSKEIDVTDGYGNFKYRPSSSKGRKVLWPREYYGRVQASASFTQSGAQVDTWEIFGSPEPTAGPRTRQYSGKSPSSLPSPEVIVAQLSDGSTICAVIPDPRREWD